ncbi:MBL fold metallo-hydrolase [Adhaeribacter radiodurans]|uniref:MBL fold metallo-hydrolase n=1 Tax=Adhaeribacter radiodurans TaxID=2745197 RepID=A0A7L7L8T0_9BACT|nr:MBL fold metallo-hydrolase [Adhaeribacter radiodurans]QMU28809.1 MBL fold metallo-hydrolase [Adhaeribacter radiodurans]
MRLHTIETGFFKLDGGAMFGVVPKSIWQRTNPADENNLCTWAMRCLLIEDGNQLILIDTGIGTKQDPKFFSHYYLHGEHTLESSLRKAGFAFSDITDVFLTHLHFDHCGGAVQYNTNRASLELTFPNATYWTNPDHYKWATEPNPREKASFLKENILPLAESGHLKFVHPQQPSPFHQFDILYVDGHTDKMMLPVIPYKDKKIVYVADLLPSVGHLPIPYVMGYDTRPLLTLQEKESFLNVAATEQYILYFEHDPVHECCTVKLTEKGVRMNEAFTLADV